jgi:hypothetical protein
MVILSSHRTQAAHLPEQPLKNIVALTQVGGNIFSGLVRQVEKNGARLEYGNRFAAVCWFRVDDGRDAVVRRDVEKRGRELLTGRIR